MPVQDARVIVMPVRGDAGVGARGDASGSLQLEGRDTPAARPAAVDAVVWGATLLAQLGLDPRTRNAKRSAA